MFLDRHTAEQAERYHTFFSAWEKVVGERIAAHSQVKDIDNGVVLVEVDHPGWIQMIQLKQTQFVQALRRRYPDLQLRGLRLQLPWDAKPAARRPDRRTGAPRGAEEARVGQTTELPPGGRRKSNRAEEAADAPADPLIKGALDRLGKAIEKREEDR